MSVKELAQERRQLRAELNAALEEEDDPLAAYDQFVKWTIKNYAEGDPESGLLELLEEATKKFKDDPSYRGDLRYLKLWCHYARLVDKPVTVFAFLAASGIGNGYALLYEEYAKALETDGRYNDADDIFRQGIKRSARPLERLKKRYKEFRHSSSSTRDSTIRPKRTSQIDVLQPGPSSITATTREPYLHIHAPTAPGRRPEKLRFDLSLLLTEDGMEYSMPESRARSMGLLGKKWAPPPEAGFSTKIRFDDEEEQDKLMASRRKSFGVRGEPTVTINTKEALADVFGMYNSPEKTIKAGRPGSKHAPVKKVEPLTPAPVARQPSHDENAPSAKTPAFKPFVDENIIHKENTTPAPKFKPFVDSDSAAFVTPDVSRRALSAKDPSAPTPSSLPRHKLADKSKAGALQPVPEEGANLTVFSKVFTPKGSPKDVFSDDAREPGPADIINVSQTPITTFVPDPNTKIPFKVFSRPPGQSTNAVAPKSAVFTPFMDAKPSAQGEEDKRPRLALDERTSLRSPQVDVKQEEEVPENMQEEYHQEAPADDYDHSDPHTPVDDGSAYSVPLGGRFGQFNVMTPITERTYDFTMSTRGMSTPRDEDAVETAERLAAELKEDEEADGRDEFIEIQEEELDSSFASNDEEPARPFGFSDEHAMPVDSIAALEKKTGTLSLVDTLTMASSFKPSNPCNPFHSSVISMLLSFIPSKGGFYDLRDQEARLLEGLQKFAHKRKRQSGNTSSKSIVDDDKCYSLSLAGRRFLVSDKLGEGGFGAVFAAKEARDDEESFIDDDWDEEENGPSMVAIKVVKPRNLWEFHILHRVHCALSPHLRQSVVLPQALYAYRDESFLVLDLCPQGTLLDIVNHASQAGVSQQGACLDELLVMFFAIELLRLIEGMHSAGFIHGDLKIDNCLLRLEDVPGGAAALSSIYSPLGDQGWSYKGIKLIDFGRTIETGLFPAGQQFVADWPVDGKDCLEMRQNRPWTYQADYYGLAGIVYCLLFGKYFETSSVTTATPVNGAVPSYKIATPFKRYWQSGIWSNLFDVLLNSGSVRPDGTLPLCRELCVVRKEMEAWLQANCNRSSGTLKGLLKKIELSVYTR